MDPIYGFYAVNVEAQAADPHSLLNWTRRMLAVRKRFRAFGRGSQRFLYPANRKVLAFLRELPGSDASDETILCVSNLSRTAQAVELDLASYAGRVPVDIVGGSVFPRVGQLTYLLTLPPYGSFWFQLAAETQVPSWHQPAPEALPEFITLVVRRELAEVLSGPARGLLETEVLPEYLPKRRWFAAKGERLLGTRIAYAVPVPDQPVILAEIEAHVGERRERYVLPMGLAWEDEALDPLVQPLALARIRRGARVGFLTDAFTLDPMVRAWIGALRGRVSVDLEDGEGRVEFRPTTLMDGFKVAHHAPIRRFSAEQSNSSLVLDDRLVLKIVRRVAAGIHPEGEMTRHLTERGFGNTAPLYGEVVRVGADGTPHTIGLAQGFVRNQGDGWTWTLDFLARSVEERAVTGETDGEDGDPGETFSEYGGFAEAIGRRLAEMHALLAEPSDAPEFAPLAADETIMDGWADSAAAQFDAALAVLRGIRVWPDPETEAEADRIIANADALRDAMRRLVHGAEGALATRIHGDFHLGQVLVVQGDAFIIDFEGEPARPMQERRAKSSGLRDLAGLLRSFDYAAAAAAPGRTAVSETVQERRLQLLQRFREDAAAAALAGYREVLHAAAQPWVAQSAEAALLNLFLIEKAAYEIRYEASNRPAWLPIPLRGLARIADRLLAREPVDA
jgi:maltose alpha-D-glucosyltransferase/alpha-amylase